MGIDRCHAQPWWQLHGQSACDHAHQNCMRAGNQNTATITQSGGGALGHWTNLSVSGNLNTHTIAQSGIAVDSTVDVKTTGSSNNFNINVNSR